MFQRLRETLTLVLLVALPFHALLVTVLTKLVAGPGHAPLTELAIWKEALLGVILLLAMIEILQRGIGALKKWDIVDGLIFSLLILALVLPYGEAWLFGFKYDFVPLIAFVLLRRVPWSEQFRKQALHLLLVVGSIVAAYGILTFFLPTSFFTALGYSDLHSLYLPDAPLPPYHQIGSSWLRRIQGPMSGPNQLGLWLLVPWSLGFTQWLKAVSSRQYAVRRNSKILLLTAYCLLLDTAILLTFSRAAWISAAVIAGGAVWLTLPRATAKRILLPAFAALCVAVVALMVVAPNVLLRQASSADHLRRPLQAIQTMVEHPFGLGLGSAGPASNRTSDACVHLEAGSDPSWAADRPNLCVFVGDTQVQPIGRACQCPLLPENWYLQIGVELGVLGFVLYIALVVLVLRKLILNSPAFAKASAGRQFSIFNSASALTFIGIAVGALFLHAFEDAAVAYTVWLLLAAL